MSRVNRAGDPHARAGALARLAWVGLLGSPSVRAEGAARALAAGRVAVGASLCAAPALAARWVGSDALAPGARVITRVLGVRDAALGFGTLASAHDATELRRWLIASSACDAFDFAATLAGPRSPGRNLVLVMAAGATVAGLAVATAVAR